MSNEIVPPVRFLETKRRVTGRGTPPDSFLDQLTTWAKSADGVIFAPNDVPKDLFSLIRPVLGPWRLTDGEPSPYLWHRRAAMCEAMRVHAGFESTWNWMEGVDTTNKTSVRNIEGQETGIFQVSHDSLGLDKNGSLQALCAAVLTGGTNSTRGFIAMMKANHCFAMDYYTRLVRQNIAWAGPLVRGEILPELSRNAVDEFMRLLA